jgi:hypothetical protein
MTSALAVLQRHMAAIAMAAIRLGTDLTCWLMNFICLPLILVSAKRRIYERLH